MAVISPEILDGYMTACLGLMIFIVPPCQAVIIDCQFKGSNNRARGNIRDICNFNAVLAQHWCVAKVVENPLGHKHLLERIGAIKPVEDDLF